jgi:NTP pyrophosphatase (non-canonical NTP hydrolase)
MDFDEYQRLSRQTAVYPHQGDNYIYPTLGLVSEAGELADRIKRIARDDDEVVTPGKVEEIASEIGDILWYAAQVSTEFGLSLNDIAQANLTKLLARLDKGTLHGFGKR